MSNLLKANLFLKTFALTKVPMILYTGAKITEFTDDHVAIEIPFHRRNRNHLNSMYFGTLCVGADLAGGFLAMKLIREMTNGKGSLVFKDFKADFVKRAEGATVFVCQDGQKIRQALQEAQQTGERVSIPVEVLATVPKKNPEEVVAKFVLTLSVKVYV